MNKTVMNYDEQNVAKTLKRYPKILTLFFCLIALKPNEHLTDTIIDLTAVYRMDWRLSFDLIYNCLHLFQQKKNVFILNV